MKTVIEIEKPHEVIAYNPQSLPTIREFHRDDSPVRCIVGPRGSGKTTAALVEICWFLPLHLKRKYGIKRSRRVVVRNTYDQLESSTMQTLLQWFPYGSLSGKPPNYLIRHPSPHSDVVVELLLRSCERAQDVRKFKSLELTGYFIDESIEVDENVKRMLKACIGRYPPKVPVRYGIETTNPPDVDHPTYSQFAWNVPPPGPVPAGRPLSGHAGFWQPPYENKENLRDGYYEEMRQDYADNPDWVDTYIEGKPGAVISGRTVYKNFRRDYHVAKESLVWDGQPLYRGWDDSGNCPACVVVMVPAPLRLHVLKEFWTDKEDIVSFGKRVVNSCNMAFPGGDWEDWGDPMGEQKYSRREGGFTSNAELLRNECGIDVLPSEQNLTARIYSVENQLARIEGLLVDPSCTRLINGFLGGYCYPEHKSIMGEYSPNILKNKYSHVAESLQYIAVKLFESKPRRELVSSRMRDDEPYSWDPLEEYR